MSWTELDAWSRRSVAGYAAQQVASGAASPAEATAYAEREFAELLPQGILTPQHWLWTVRDAAVAPVSDAAIGQAWLQVRPRPGEVEAFLVDVSVEEQLRGRGLGTTVLLAVEQAARDLGADVLRLSVFGHNQPALRLYDSLGYRVARTALNRSPGPGTPAAAVLHPIDDEQARERVAAAAVAQLVNSGTATHAVAVEQVAGLAGELWAGPADAAVALQVLGTAEDPLVVAHHVLPGSSPMEPLLDAVEQHPASLPATRLSVTAYDEKVAAALEARGYRVTAQTRVKRW